LVNTEQASPGAGDFAAVAKVIRVAQMTKPAERPDRDIVPPRELAPTGTVFVATKVGSGG
jgi:hypothetical protein